MIWTEESAALLWRAYMAGTACRELVEWMNLPAHARVCDAGCGVGALSRALAMAGMQVTAVDVSETALAPLRACREAALIDIRCMDIEAHAPDAPYDAMVFCFFGDIDRCLRLAKRLCRGEVFYISRNYDMHRFSVGAHRVRYSGYRDARARLDALDVPYSWAERELDVSQPFRDLDEARRFFTLHSRDDASLITDAFLHSRLERTQAGDYPLMLAHRRAAGMLRFHVRDIPAFETEK